MDFVFFFLFLLLLTAYENWQGKDVEGGLLHDLLLLLLQKEPLIFT